MAHNNKWICLRRTLVIFAAAALMIAFSGCTKDALYGSLNTILSGTEEGDSVYLNEYQGDRKQVIGSDLTIAEKIQGYDADTARKELSRLYSPGGSAQALKTSMNINGFSCLNEGRRSLICSPASSKVAPRWDAIFSISGDTVGELTITPAGSGLR